MRGPHAEVHTAPEREVRVGFAVQSHFRGRLECRRVHVGRCPAQRCPRSRFHRDAVDVRCHGANASDVGQRRETPEEFLARVHDAARIRPQVFKGFSATPQIGKHGRHRVDDRVASAREGQVGEAHHFIAGQRTSLVGRLGQRREEVGSRLGHSPVQLGLEILFECGPLLPSVTAIPEHVGTPADPDLGFGQRHVQQVRQGA